MYFGKIVEMAAAEDLFTNPCHPYTRALLSAIPQPNPVTEKTRKRIHYIPALVHDYREEPPSLREISPGHLVMCNTQEFEQYSSSLKQHTPIIS